MYGQFRNFASTSLDSSSRYSEPSSLNSVPLYLANRTLSLTLRLDLLIVSHGYDQTGLWLFFCCLGKQQTRCGFAFLVQWLDEHRVPIGCRLIFFAIITSEV